MHDNDMHDNDIDAKHIEEYKKLLRQFASIATNHPDMVSQLRMSLETSAALMISNSEETVSKFRELTKEMDAFLHACQTGEMDPRRLLASFDKESQ